MLEPLNVNTKSITTAGALMAATGITPRVLHRRDGVTFEFPPEAADALQRYFAAKQYLDRMAEEGVK